MLSHLEKSNAEERVVLYGAFSICELFVIIILLVILISIICARTADRFFRNDEGHEASAMLCRVNRERRAKLKMMMLHPRRLMPQTKRKGSQDVELVHSDSLQSDSNAAEDVPITTSGFTDKLAKNYVEALKLAEKFGKSDPKISRLLLQDKQMRSLQEQT